MSDALLWFAEQPFETTGEVLSITELRSRGVVRPETRAKPEPLNLKEVSWRPRSS